MLSLTTVKLLYIYDLHVSRDTLHTQASILFESEIKKLGNQLGNKLYMSMISKKSPTIIAEHFVKRIK